MKKLEDWITSEKIFADDNYISDDFILIVKDKILTWKYSDELLSLIKRLNTGEQKNLLCKVPFERGEEIELPTIVHLGRNEQLFFIIETDGKKIPFNYEKVKQILNCTNTDYLTVCKVNDILYVLKFFDEDNEFCGIVAGCTEVKNMDVL